MRQLAPLSAPFSRIIRYPLHARAQDAESTSVAVHEPTRPQYTFKSATPRLRKDAPCVASPGQNTAPGPSWNAPLYTAKGESGRVREGPQLGSFEHMEGLGRAASPNVRTPDVIYSLDMSLQKRPLAKVSGASRIG